MKGPDMYSLSDGGYCHGEKKALFSTSSPRFFFCLLLFLLTLQSCVSFIHLRVVFADKLCHLFEFAVSAFHMQVAPWPLPEKFQYDARLPKQCLRINLLKRIKTQLVVE